MDGLLALNGLAGWLEGYVQLREKSVALGPKAVSLPFRPKGLAVLRVAAVEGEIARCEPALF